jgi:oxygen-dependent protoporphyrinogen oxidase
MTRRVVVVGGGISGLAAAHALAVGPRAAELEIELREAGDDVGGKLRTTPFAGLDAVDEGADAFLVRVPHALELARDVGLADELTAPAASKAAVWRGRLRPIPERTVLGVPASVSGLVTSSLLSWPGRVRAVLEPLVPRTSVDEDSIGSFVRGRFGDEVQELLVDALVGSIYGAETDRSSLAMVPQLAALAGDGRSALLAARRRVRQGPADPGPVFLAPIAGMGRLAHAVADCCRARGVTIRTGAAVTELARDGDRWRVDGDPADAVVVATPARRAAPLLDSVAPETSRLLAQLEYAGVAIVTVAVGDWPEQLGGLSGYLVPKRAQRTVTAASFGSQKWPHWTPAGGQVLRISLGRDGLPVDHLDDGMLTARAVDEVGRHLALDLQPTATRVSRWPHSFPQYRPHHLDWLARVDASLPPGLHLTGASYRGIGVPACIADARATADRAVEALGGLDR